MRDDVKVVVKRGWALLSMLLGIAMMMGLGSLAWPGQALAATIVVNSLDDTVVSGDGVCTLREAVLNAEGDNHSGSTDCAAGSGADTITFSLSGTISLASGLTITTAGGLTIDGGEGITMRGFFPFASVLTVDAPGVLTLRHLTVTDGGNGGISNSGTLTINHSIVSGNSSYNGIGAGILNGGAMTISHSTVSGNVAVKAFAVPNGAGIHNQGTLTISNSTVNGNQVDGYHSPPWGGGIYNGGTLTISNSTISDNGCGHACGSSDSGGGIYNEGILTISHSTISNNFGPQPTGLSNTGTVKMSTSLIADGCLGPITSLGYNLDKTGTCGLTGPGDQSSIDPRLDPAGLKDNGGPTKTIALCTGPGTPAGCTGKSPAIDAVPRAHCTGAGGQPLGLDQRAFFRPADGDGKGTARCDTGAFEATSAPLQTINRLVTYKPLPATFRTSQDTTGCPVGSVGTFRFTADVTHKAGSPSVSHLLAEVASLTKGTLVLNADGGLGGDGATVTVAPSGQYTDGVLSAKQHVSLPVTLCLKTFTPFTFNVDVLGTTHRGPGHHGAAE